MTRKELSQLYYLEREIRQQEEQLAELEAEARSMTAKLNGMPRSGGTERFQRLLAEIADMKTLIDLNIEKRIVEKSRLMRAISDVEDSLLRQILTCRYLYGMSWDKVASRIGGKNTKDSVRMAHKRYLNKK